MGDICSTYGERRGVYRVLVGKPVGERPIGRPRRVWENNIKTGLQGVGCGGIDWIELAQDRGRRGVVVNAVIKAENRLASEKGLCSMEYVVSEKKFGSAHILFFRWFKPEHMHSLKRLLQLNNLGIYVKYKDC
jgi:hypothetical protein